MDIYLANKTAVKLENSLCVKLGFCSMQEKYNEIINELPTDITEFVNSIFIAEGLNPDSADRKLWRQVRDLVMEAHHEFEEKNA